MISNPQTQLPRRRAHDAIVAAAVTKRFAAPAIALLACLVLGSCSSFSGFVSDHWPTWAGGMPNDVPPRPGAPGYEEFIKHQQVQQTPAPAATASAAPAAAPAAMPVAAQAPAANPNAQAAPAGARPADDQGTARGGLY